MFRIRGERPEVLLVHPGGPFWKNKDAGAWTIPKGEPGENEEPQAAARREFREELGVEARGSLVPLGSVRQKGGKTVLAFALEGDIDPSAIVSNVVEIDWPPRSGRKMRIPEVDRAAYFDLADARNKINPAQQEFLDRLSAWLVESGRLSGVTD